MKIDKDFCMNSYLTYRGIVQEDIGFSSSFPPRIYKPYNIEKRKKVYDSKDTFKEIKNFVDSLFNNTQNNIALMLSGGIDSAILAALVPEGTKAYTFKNDASESLDDVIYARKYAQLFKLNHEIIEVSWDDFNNIMDSLMLHKGAPIHSIEPQIYKAALAAKESGYNTLLFGENADIVFGGFNGLLAKDWTTEEFYQRYGFVDPKLVLNNPQKIIKPILKYTNSMGEVDVHSFINDVFYTEANSSYENACSLAKIRFTTPFNRLKLGSELDLKRVRSGENKYILREIFAKLYPNFENRKKIPMPRAVDKWFSNWSGPTRKEFKKIEDMNKFSGDQKWMIYCLERFLNLIEDTNEK
ncbi:asparagine synthase C-terminal domain-containing protein [Enterococcus faecium]|uniref:asparagine synthase C-terminal domain-containing protein n=1 Tax=Enterococcus faecium TaxID=1352 RepID=UPI0015E35942|nr:asparagine synthase C-terminal domain-containing protein [Enterococcus faecium]